MLTLFAAIVVAGVGALIFWSNPSRAVNRVAFSCSLHIATWLLLLYLAVGSKEGLLWVRWICAVSAWVPFHFWLVKESIAANFDYSEKRRLRRSGGWVLFSVILASICFTEYFIPSHSTSAKRVYGWGYYGYILGILGAYGYLLSDAYKDLRRLSGGRRLELQVWLGGGCAMAGAILALMTLNAVTHDPRYVRLQPLVVLVFYAGTTAAITMQRIFDARQILLVALEKLVLIVIVAGVAYLADQAFGPLLPSPVDFLVTTAIALWFAVTLNGWLDRVFRFYPEATAARQAAFAAARNESRVEHLEKAFLKVLKGWGQSDHAVVLAGPKEALSGGGINLSGDSIVVAALRQLRWVTPERLARERSSPGRLALGEFLKTHGLGVLVIGEGPALTAFVGVGVPASRRPFTYPQVTQLMELASIVESALERAHFSVKAQRAEQLATVGLLGASLAHEIRNPLVTIKTFVQLLPEHHQDVVFREKFFRLIGDEVNRIDRLTEQLLDLASPRAYMAELIELHPVLRASLDLVAAKATHKDIQFLTDFQAKPDRVFTDGSAAKQVMLNLCFNAIQAIEACDGNRWVKISTRNTTTGVEMAVADSGPGIATEIRARLFQPFQTTKSSGFGLGLAICSDILANLSATISVDPPSPGAGATFRVIFPCQPS